MSQDMKMFCCDDTLCQGFRCAADIADKDDCAEWREKGYCHLNPGYMWDECARTCGVPYCRKELTLTSVKLDISVPVVDDVDKSCGIRAQAGGCEDAILDPNMATECVETCILRGSNNDRTVPDGTNADNKGKFCLAPSSLELIVLSQPGLKLRRVPQPDSSLLASWHANRKWAYLDQAYIDCADGWYPTTPPNYISLQVCALDETNLMSTESNGPPSVWTVHPEKANPPQCKRRSCPAAPVIQSAPQLGITVKSNYEFEDVIGYSCDTGFIVKSGDTSRTCQSNETWSGSDLVCERRECGIPPQVADMTLTYSTRYYENQITYQCNYGFQPDDIPGNEDRFSQSCVLINPTTVAWRPSGTPACVSVNCGTPPPMNIAKLVFQPNSTRYPSSVVFTCLLGAESSLVVNDIQLKTSEFNCTADGTWSGSNLKCLWVSCGRPPKIPYSRILRYDASSFNKTVEYECDWTSGYESSNKTVEKVSKLCNEFGSWEGPDLVCEKTKLLTVGKNQKKTEIEDDGSAAATGSIFIFIMGALIGFIVFLDYTTIGRDLKTMKRNLSNVSHRWRNFWRTRELRAVRRKVMHKEVTRQMKESHRPHVPIFTVAGDGFDGIVDEFGNPVFTQRDHSAGPRHVEHEDVDEPEDAHEFPEEHKINL